MTRGKRRESIFIPVVEELNVEESDLDESPDNTQINTEKESLKMLNEFLACRDVSPVRHKLSIPWDSAHEHTKRRYSRKAKQSVCKVLEVIAPGQSDKLLSTLGGNLPSERTQAEVELSQALAESYLNATHWSTRRQILSIMADKVPLNELTQYIPGITSYRFNVTRHHKLLHGRGAVVSVDIAKRMKVDYSKVDHFLNFITNPHIVQDMPFGERMLKLSTREVVKTPNVVRMLIPERITQQYFQVCAETEFTPVSKRTLLRVLEVCSASVRKLLQGLENFSAQGTKAFEDLCETIDRIADQAKSQAWAKETKQALRYAKQYLRADYNVRLRNSLIRTNKRAHKGVST